VNKLKVLVVDDSVVYRKILVAAVESTGLAVVEQSASNGVIALERLLQQHFDVVLLDQMMPEMTGIEALAVIRDKYPEIAVIMISGYTKENAVETVQALEMGALDFILKPSDSSEDRNMEIIRNHLHVLFAQVQIKQSARRVNPNLPKSNEPRLETEVSRVVPALKAAQKTRLAKVDLVVIASSTGGPVALEQLCSGWSQKINKPILIVQHMPAEFTKVLADSLGKRCLMPVWEGVEGSPVTEGQIVIAPGGYHMVIQAIESGQHVLRMEKTEYVNGVRPAADVLFRSVAEIYPQKNILAVVMTGMGNDGTVGVREMKQRCNCYCMTQGEATCTIYGMPKCVCEAGLSDEVVDLGDIARRIQQIVAMGVNNR
jgi:two-component system, chemotaxis family, protein-glutamate methylesterase/glutaminase